MDIETYIVKKANEFARSNEKRMKITKYIAKYGHLLFVIYGAVYFLLPGRTQRERRKNCISILVSICISSIISFFIGKKFYRNRPFVKDKNIKDITNHKANASFPSNHTMNGAIVLMYLLKEKAPFSKMLVPIWIAMSVSRVFAGIHYISDLAGGVFIASMVYKIKELIFQNKRG